MRTLLSIGCLLLCFYQGNTQSTATNIYNPAAAFAFSENAGPGNTRTPDGRPGPGYWQNRADYQVAVSFDTLTRMVRGVADITYYNNSPQALSYVWLVAGQNRFRKDSRVALLTPAKGTRFGVNEYTTGCEIQSLETGASKRSLQPATWEVTDTYIKVRLSTPLLPGKKTAIKVAYNFQLPYNGSDYMGILPTAHGAVYQLSSLFPRVAVYDAVQGWNGLASGYYVEPGSLDVRITVPAGLIVQGTGVLKNPEEVLSPQMLARYRQAEKSDTVISIRSIAEVTAVVTKNVATTTANAASTVTNATGTTANAATTVTNATTTTANATTTATNVTATTENAIAATGKTVAFTAPTPAGSHTWRFVADNAGDGLWGISASFLWDAVKVNLPGGRTALAMALYPPESNGEWKQITGQMKRMLETYSRLWTPYPYATAVNIAGSITGVAGPAVSIIDYRKSGYGNTLWIKTNHELGHTWFNIMTAADSKNGWMAEGLNTFINLINCDTLKGNVAFTISDAAHRLSADIGIPALNTPAASVRPAIMAVVMYIKPAVALHLLRNKIIGSGKFDPVFRDFMTNWAFKHPTPNDFFRAMENGTGEDLGWFWRGWFLNDWKLDQAIKEVAYVNEDPLQGVNITIANRGQQVMPVDVDIRQTNGAAVTLHFPAQVWQTDSVHTFHYASVAPVEKVILDPGKELPDIDRSNNTWEQHRPVSVR